VLGGPVIHSFAFALMVGFVVGTYSSIYVAAAIVVIWKEWQDKGKLAVVPAPVAPSATADLRATSARFAGLWGVPYLTGRLYFGQLKELGTLAVGAADLCGTGYPDLFLANDYGVSEVYANRGGKQFVEIGKNCDIGTHPKSGMNVSFGDIYNDGRRAIYISNITEPGQILQFNNLWVPDRKLAGSLIR
jgi:hypothetical protein